MRERRVRGRAVSRSLPVSGPHCQRLLGRTRGAPLNFLHVAGKSPEFRPKHLRVALRLRGEIRPGGGVSLLGSLGSPATTSSVDHTEVSSLLGIFPRDATGWGRAMGPGEWTDAPSHVAGMAVCSGVLFRGHIWRKEVHLMASDRCLPPAAS